MRSTHRNPLGRADARDSSAGSSAQRAVAGFPHGDSAAVAEVQDRVSRIIGSKGYGIPRAQQEELAQEVLIQVWQAVNRDGFDPRRGFWGFVQTVAVRRCIDWRRRRRESSIDSVSLVPDWRRGPLRRLLAAEQHRAANAAVIQLSPECRELIEFRIAEERSYTEISGITGQSEQALRAQMYRCIKKARTLMGEVEGA